MYSVQPFISETSIGVTWKSLILFYFHEHDFGENLALYTGILLVPLTTARKKLLILFFLDLKYIDDVLIFFLILYCNCWPLNNL